MARPPRNGHEARRRRTRRAILASAARLFDAHGYRATTVADIAHCAGVSERTFYVHFAAKEDLLFAHVQDFTEMAWRVARESKSPDPADRVRAAVLALIDLASSDDAFARNAPLRSLVAARGELPRSLATQVLTLSRGLAVQIAEDTKTPLPTVAPMVGAAIGAVEAAGFVAATNQEANGTLQKDALVRSVEAALQGFRVLPDDVPEPA